MLPRLRQLHEMMEAIFKELVRQGLPLDLPCDHVCYRVETPERYEALKASWLASLGTLAAETPVNGRPISIIQLKKPFAFKSLEIECLELPAPKPGSSYAEGWEHAEFVTGGTLEAFLGRFPRVAFEKKSLGKEINPEIALPVPGGYQLKFHPATILEVIAEEKRRDSEGLH